MVEGMELDVKEYPRVVIDSVWDVPFCVAYSVVVVTDVDCTFGLSVDIVESVIDVLLFVFVNELREVNVLVEEI